MERIDFLLSKNVLQSFKVNCCTYGFMCDLCQRILWKNGKHCEHVYSNTIAPHNPKINLFIIKSTDLHLCPQGTGIPIKPKNYCPQKLYKDTK